MKNPFAAPRVRLPARIAQARIPQATVPQVIENPFVVHAAVKPARVPIDPRVIENPFVRAPN